MQGGCLFNVPGVQEAASRWSSVFTFSPDAVFIVVIYAIDAAAPVVVVPDVSAVTQLLVVGPLLTEQLSKLI